MAKSIIIGAEKLTRYLSDLAKKQVPYATAKTLSFTAYRAAMIIRKEMPRRFNIRRQWVVQGLRYTKATKKDLRATVYHRDFYMPKQETGGEHIAFKGRLAIPTRDIQPNIKKSIPRKKRPENILKSDPKTFLFPYSIVKRKGGKKIRRDKSRGAFYKKFKVLYALRKSVRLKPRLGAEDMTRYAVREIFPGKFRKELLNAFATAKRK